MDEAISELELWGPPSSVGVRIRSDDREEYAGVLPIDSIDAESWPYLLVWLLAWAVVPPSLWDLEFVHGEFAAKDAAQSKFPRLLGNVAGRLSPLVYR